MKTLNFEHFFSDSIKTSTGINFSKLAQKIDKHELKSYFNNRRRKMEIIGGLGMHACSPPSIAVNENRFDNNALVPDSGYLIEKRLLNK